MTQLQQQPLQPPLQPPLQSSLQSPPPLQLPQHDSGSIEDLRSACVLDPMVGRAGILLEAVLGDCGGNGSGAATNARRLIGVDLDIDQLAGARANLLHAGGAAVTAVELLRGDATCLPFGPDTVDVIVTDMPFGKRHQAKISKARGSKATGSGGGGGGGGGGDAPHELYPALLGEFWRVLKPGASAVLLTTYTNLLGEIVSCEANGWKAGLRTAVFVGGLKAYIHVLKKRH